MAVSAHDVAVVLRERLPGLPATKLHTLLYYCQGHHVAAFGEPLFPERVEAWDVGPVVAELWREEKYGTPGTRYAETEHTSTNAWVEGVPDAGDMRRRCAAHGAWTEADPAVASAALAFGEANRRARVAAGLPSLAGPAADAAGLGEGQLNTIGYVLSRYGALTGRDLELLGRAGQPWRLAGAGRGRGGRAVVTTASMRSYFAAAGAPGEDGDVPPLDSAEVAEMLRDAAGRRARPARPDTADDIRAWSAKSA